MPSRSSPISIAAAKWRASSRQSVAGSNWPATRNVVEVGKISETVSRASSIMLLLFPNREPALRASVRSK